MNDTSDEQSGTDGNEDVSRSRGLVQVDARHFISLRGDYKRSANLPNRGCGRAFTDWKLFVRSKYAHLKNNLCIFPQIQEYSAQQAGEKISSKLRDFS